MRACICVHENNEFSSRWPSRRHRATNKWMWKRKPIVFVTIRCIRANWEFYGHKQRDQIFPFMSTFTPFATAQHTDSFTLSGCESGVIHGNIYIYMHGNVVADIMALAAGSSLSLVCILHNCTHSHRTVHSLLYGRRCWFCIFIFK